MPNIETPELKPCPFCGGEAHFDHNDSNWQWIECDQCHASTNFSVSAMEDCKPILAESWNRRIVTDPARDAAIRAESAELLRVCGEALNSANKQTQGVNAKVRTALAALKDAGVRV